MPGPTGPRARSAGTGKAVPIGRRLLGVHRWLYERTGGRLGHRLLIVPCLVLRTTGRRTGILRSTVLAYTRDDDAYLVVASNFGDDRHPDWLLNLRAKPSAEVQIGRVRKPVTAHVVEPADEDSARLWSLVNAADRQRHRHLAEKTDRPVPVVVLTPEPVPGVRPEQRAADPKPVGRHVEDNRHA